MVAAAVFVARTRRFAGTLLPKRVRLGSRTALPTLVEIAGLGLIARGAFLAGPIWGYVVTGVLLLAYASLGDLGGD